MRTLFIATFVFIASFGIFPGVVSAQSGCDGAGAFEQSAPDGTACFTDNNVPGICRNGTCQPRANPPGGGNPTNPPQGNNPGTTLINPLGSASLETFLLNILDFVIRIGSIIVILMLVFVGFKFVTAQGKPGEIEAARGMFLWTVVGALILLGAKAIALGIKATVQALGG